MVKEIDIVRKKELLTALKIRRDDFFALLQVGRNINGRCSLCNTYLELYEEYKDFNHHCSQCPAGEKICSKFIKKRIKIDKEIREMVRYLDVEIRKARLWLQVQK